MTVCFVWIQASAAIHTQMDVIQFAWIRSRLQLFGRMILLLEIEVL